METKLAKYSRKDLENNLKIALEKLSSVLRSRATKFNSKKLLKIIDLRELKIKFFRFFCTASFEFKKRIS